MPIAAVDWFICPVCRVGPLRLAEGLASKHAAPHLHPGEVESGCVVRGTLTCPECRRQFPIDDGIPNLLPDPGSLEAAEASAKHDERSQRDREAGIYDRNLPLRLLSLFELPATLARLRPAANEHILEVGSGTGRFTVRLAAMGAHVLALDHSRESLRLAREKVARQPGTTGARIVFAQADASYLPVRDAWADRALSCQMLEHLPTSDSRGRAVGEMARVLKPGGALVLSAYWHQPVLSRWTMKEGRHSGRIYFYRFTRAELVSLLGRHFNVRSVTGGLIYILLALCERR